VRIALERDTAHRHPDHSYLYKQASRSNILSSVIATLQVHVQHSSRRIANPDNIEVMRRISIQVTVESMRSVDLQTQVHPRSARVQ
jgi:hypothetical protein